MPRTDKLIVELFGSFKQGEKDCFEKILLRHGVDERFLDLMHALNPNSKNKLHDKDKHKIHEIMFTKDDNVVEFNDFYLLKPQIEILKKLEF